MDLDLLETFLAIEEMGSFTNAAKKVGRTQSAISQQIARLEIVIGKPLFIREKNLSLTPSGELLLGYAKKLIALHKEMLARLTEPALQGEVRFGLPEDFATVFLADVLADFSRIHPGIHLHIECDLTLNLLDRFRHDELDLVLLKMAEHETMPGDHVISSQPLEWVGKQSDFSPDNPIPLVLSPKPCFYRAAALDALENAHKPWHLVFSSPSYTGTIAAVRAGMGVTVLPRNMIPKDLAKLPLPPLQKTHISLRKKAGAGNAVDSLEEFVVKQLRQT